MKKSLVVVCCVIVLCSLLAIPLLLRPPSTTSPGEPQTTPQSTTQPTPTSTPQSTPQNTPHPTSTGTQPPTNNTTQQAVEKATNYVAQTDDPYVLLMLNVLYRRFGITEFKDSLQRFDQLLAANPENAPILRVFRRIADYNNSVLQPGDSGAVTADVDVITVPALYSDRSSLPANYPSMLINAENSGSYMLTHALLATIWLQDNHYSAPMPDDFTESLYHANAALAGNGLVVTDLELEAAAFLYLAGQGTLVSDAFVQRVIATQNDDGGWSPSSDTHSISSWHASVLGLMILLHVEFPAASYPPMLAPASGYNGVCMNPFSVFSITIWLFCLIYMRKRTAILFKITNPSRDALQIKPTI